MDRLAKRFFDIIEEGGAYAELYAIRDLMMSEYINGDRSQVEVLQIDDIIEEIVEETVIEEVVNIELDDNKVIEAYKRMWEGELERAFELINEYGEYVNSHPYIYYSLVRNIERVTGENYIEICL